MVDTCDNGTLPPESVLNEVLASAVNELSQLEGGTDGRVGQASHSESPESRWKKEEAILDQCRQSMVPLVSEPRSKRPKGIEDATRT